MFKASSLRRRQEYLSSWDYVSISSEWGGASNARHLFFIISASLAGPGCTGQALAGWNRQPASNGHMPASNGAGEGNQSKPRQPLQPDEASPQRTGPQAALMNSLNDGTRTGTRKKLSEGADKLTGG